MKKFYPIFLLPFIIFPSLAEDESIFDAEAAISSVTVYLDRADVTRSTEMEMDAGNHIIRFKQLPGQLQQQSLRLDGKGNFTLLNLQTRRVLLEKADSEEVQALEETKTQLELEITSLEQALKRIQSSRELVHAIGRRFTSSPAEGSESPSTEMEPWKGLLQFQESEIARLDADERETSNEVGITRQALKRVEERLRDLGAMANRRQLVADARISLSEAATITLDLSYIVPNAGWQPSYDLRVGEDLENVEITYFGEIRQASGEDWSNVALRLSTAQPMIGGVPPALYPWYLQIQKEEPKPMLKARAAMPATAASPREESTDLFEDLSMKLAATEVETGATAVVFSAKDKVTVPGDRSPIRVPIMSESLEADFHYITIPKLASYAYLQAKATNSTDYPILPGSAHVFLGNRFIAETRLTNISPGESFTVSLGVDTGITVERHLIEHKKDTAGLMGGSTRMDYAYRYTISNNKPTPVKIVLEDQIPISTDDTIRVTLRQPDPSRNEDVTLTDQNYIRWDLTLQPGETIEKDLVFRVQFPRDEAVVGLPPIAN